MLRIKVQGQDSKHQQSEKKLMTQWTMMNTTYFANLTESMPKQLEIVIKRKGDMTK